STVWLDEVTLMELTPELHREHQKRAIANLIRLREDGINTLLNRDVRSGEAWMHFAADLSQWESDVLKALTQTAALESEITDFRVLGTFVPQGLPGGTELHARDRNILAEKLDRLLRTIRAIE